MSNFLMLIIGGWTSTAALIGFYALKESGEVLKTRKRIRLWLEGIAQRGRKLTAKPA